MGNESRIEALEKRVADLEKKIQSQPDATEAIARGVRQAVERAIRGTDATDK